jgi:hypothetical protein
MHGEMGRTNAGSSNEIIHCEILKAVTMKLLRSGM